MMKRRGFLGALAGFAVATKAAISGTNELKAETIQPPAEPIRPVRETTGANKPTPADVCQAFADRYSCTLAIAGNVAHFEWYAQRARSGAAGISRGDFFAPAGPEYVFGSWTTKLKPWAPNYTLAQLQRQLKYQFYKSLESGRLDEKEILRVLERGQSRRRRV